MSRRTRDLNPVCIPIPPWMHIPTVLMPPAQAGTHALSDGGAISSSIVAEKLPLVKSPFVLSFLVRVSTPGRIRTYNIFSLSEAPLASWATGA